MCVFWFGRLAIFNLLVFFFQAEDGIRDGHVTGVQTCALPIFINRASSGRILFVTDVNQNVGKLETAGIDFAVRYALRTSAGRFGFIFDATWLASYDRTQTT